MAQQTKGRKRQRRHGKLDTFRVGQIVCSIYDPGRTFQLDKSVVPERIFRERGSNRWWTRNELQRPGRPENPITSSRLNGKEQMRGMHPKCAAEYSDEADSKAVTNIPGLPQRSCVSCGVNFQPTRHWQKFHSEGCRRAHWKRPSAEHPAYANSDAGAQRPRPGEGEQGDQSAVEV
jgi:hypothetical protein